MRGAAAYRNCFWVDQNIVSDHSWFPQSFPHIITEVTKYLLSIAIFNIMQLIISGAIRYARINIMSSAPLVLRRQHTI